MLAALVLAGAGPADAQRQGAERGRFEVPGMDWAPNSAWRPRAQVVRANREALLRRGDVRGLNGPGPLLSRAGGGGTAALAVSGTFHVPVVAIQYRDVDVAFPVDDFRDVLFATAPPQSRPYTLKTYYEEVSGGRIQMFGRVFTPVRTDSTAAYYQQSCNGIGVLTTCPDGGRRFGLMLLAVLDSISNRPGGDTVWAQFDNDGPDGLPNSGDDDGDVDFVTFLQPVKDGACAGSPGVWAHRWVISAWNGGSKYVTKTPRRNAAGQPIPGQFIRVNNYTMQSQLGGVTGCDAPLPPDLPTVSQILPVGTVAHETGHAFGLPDLYDTDRIGSGTEGIGEWGIMGSGNYARAYSPAGYDPWSLYELGWATIEELAGTRTVRTGPRQTSDTVFLARTGNPNELFLIENRQAAGSDTAMLNPNNPNLPTNTPPCRSNCRKAPGLLLWHVDLTRIAAGRSSNTVNTGPIQGVSVVQADGFNHLRSSAANRNRGDHGDPFPGTSQKTAFTLQSVPAARLNTGEYIGFIVDQIAQLPNGEMSFRFLRRNPTVVRSALPTASIRVNGTVASRFEEVLPAGTQFTIGADSLQFAGAGRTKARFLAWSIGGPRDQTITSGALPDTISATFSAEHRLLATTTGTGAGAVTASVAGDLAAGTFYPAGTAVTVTATPAAGAVFGGWRGDTTAATPVLALVVGRPYDLEATFVAQVAVAVSDATAEVLGTPRLSDQQRSFLDLLGNRNGLFDLGDYLALLRREGQAAPPAALRAATGAARPGRGN